MNIERRKIVNFYYFGFLMQFKYFFNETNYVLSYNLFLITKFSLKYSSSREKTILLSTKYMEIVSGSLLYNTKSKDMKIKYVFFGQFFFKYIFNHYFKPDIK